jgi:hypothetical protein
MTHTKDEALKLALEALEWISNLETGRFIRQKATEPIAAIKQALAAPVQEPVCIGWDDKTDTPVMGYTTPPAAQPAVPDAFGTREGEHPEYIQGWNDCRAEILKGKA